MHIRKIVAAAACAALMSAGGCGPTYYKVTDPTTGKDYYTTELKKHQHGSATLKDAKSGAEVSLQNVEVRKIKKEEYDVGRYAQPAPAPEKEKQPEPTPFK